MALTATPIRETGFSFVRVPIEMASNSKPETFSPVTDERHIVMVIENGRLMQQGLLAAIETNPWAYRYRTGYIGFTPFDMKAEFPGRHVMLLNELAVEFDFDAWARTQVEVPPDIDVTFERDRNGRREVSVVARTVKKGKLANVRVKVDPGVPFAQAVAPILEGFRRTAPAPVVDMFAEPLPDYTCGAHVAALLATLDDVGLPMVEKWIADDLGKRENVRAGYRYEGSSVTVPGAFLIGSKVDRIVLSTTRKSNAVHAEVSIRGGHKLVDDETGSSVTLEAQLPEAVVASLRKRSLGDVIDADWAKPLLIRTVPVNDGNTVTFRAFSDNVPFALGAPTPFGDEEVERRLRRAFVDGRPGPDGGRAPLWNEVDTAIVHVLQGMDRRALSIVVTRLEMSTSADLAEFGWEGWTLRSQGNRIIAERQPPVPVGGLGLTRDEEGRKAA